MDAGELRGRRVRLQALWASAPLFIALLLIILIGLTTAWLVHENRRQNELVVHTFTVINEANRWELNSASATAQQRGYMLTRDPAFLGHFRNSIDAMTPSVERLVRLTADNGAQHRRAREIQALAQARVRELWRVQSLIESDDRQAAMAAVAVARVQNATLRDRLNEFRATEVQLLNQRQARAASSGRWVLVLVITGLATATVLAVGVIQALRRTLGQVRESNALVTAANETLEARVRERTAELVEANEELQRFAYIVSHDLRAPLVNVMGFTAELSESLGTLTRFAEARAADGSDALPGEVRRAIGEDLPEAIGFINASSAKMDRLIKAILNLARAGRRTLTPEPTSLDWLVAGVVATLKHQIDSAGARVEVGSLPTIEADRVMLDQIFANLIENAVKYRRANVAPVIRVEGELAGPVATIRVIDNGRGIAPADQGRVFELFRRAGAQDQPGEGLGLAHVRALVRRLGGGIALASTPGVGSIFTVTLPRHPPMEERLHERQP